MACLLWKMSGLCSGRESSRIGWVCQSPTYCWQKTLQEIFRKSGQLLVRRTPRKELDELLLTRDSRFICAQTMRTALMNSALFCEELVVWMLNKYPGRFRVYEDTPVQRIRLSNGSFDGKVNRANLETVRNLVNAKHAVLCTNGYNDLEIEAMGVPIDTAMKGLIGFMVGYRHKEERGAAASVYFSSRRSGEEGYFYMTRRRYIDGPDRELTWCRRAWTFP